MCSVTFLEVLKKKYKSADFHRLKSWREYNMVMGEILNGDHLNSKIYF